MRLSLSSLLSSALAIAACGTASLAHASLISVGLQQAGVNSGNITTVATDGGLGSVSYSGTYGTFVFNAITATGAPILSAGTLDTTSLQAVSNASSPGGTMYVYITEQGLTSPSGSTSFLSGFTSNLFAGSAISVVESTFYSNTNQQYAGTLLASTIFTGQSTASSVNVATLGNPYSETIEYAIKSGAGTASVNDTVNLTATGVTPEPSSLVLLGTGLIGAATTAMRRRKLSV